MSDTPTVVFSDNLAEIANLSTENFVYTLTFSESVTGLTADDFTIDNAVINTVSGSGQVWTVDVSPDLWVENEVISLTLNAGAVTAAGGRLNEEASDSSQTIDTFPPFTKLVTNDDFNYLTNPQLTMETNYGTAVIELYPEQAPATVANMLAYVAIDFYDDTMFHRVIDGFMVQGGGFADTGYSLPSWYDPIVLESDNGLTNERGTIAMARTSVPDSATTQFFVNLVDNDFLDYSSASSPGYAVFGAVLSGMEVFDAIAQVETTTVGAYSDVPVTPVNMATMELTQSGVAVADAGAVLNVDDLEEGAQWDYSLDGGATWITGTGSSFELPDGTYAEGMIVVRQTDAAGNDSIVNAYLPTTLTIEAVEEDDTPSICYSEEFYLLNNPDVATAVSAGIFANGWEHYSNYGYLEGRSFARPDAYGDFSEYFYALNNPDVAAAVEAGAFINGWEHYSDFGQAEGRTYAAPEGYGDFSEELYLLNNPDVAAAVEAGYLSSGWDHYSRFGQTEGRTYVAPEGYADFNEEFYFLNNPDVAAAVDAGYLSSGWAHYLSFGQAEGRSYAMPEEYGDFNEELYLLNNPDVAAAVDAGYLINGWEHYANFGQAEGRSYQAPEQLLENLLSQLDDPGFEGSLCSWAMDDLNGDDAVVLLGMADDVLDDVLGA